MKKLIFLFFIIFILGCSTLDEAGFSSSMKENLLKDYNVSKLRYENYVEFSNYTIEQINIDCSYRNGVFQECGSACDGPGYCIQVCVPLCELN